MGWSDYDRWRTQTPEDFYGWGEECDRCDCETPDNRQYGRDNGAGEWVVCFDWPKVCTCPDYECEPCECRCHIEPDYD